MTKPAAKRKTGTKPTPTKARATKRTAAGSSKRPTEKSRKKPAAPTATPDRGTFPAQPKGRANPLTSSAKRSASSASTPRTDGTKTRGARQTFSRAPSKGRPAKPAQKKPAQKKPAQKKPAQKKPAQKTPAQKKPARPAQKRPARPARPAQKKPARLGKPGRAAPPKGGAQKKKARKLSQKPEAIKARKRRQEQKAIEEQKRQARNERRRQKRKEKAGKVDERDLAIGWLEHIRDDFSTIVPTSLTITEAEAAAKTPWLVVGRYDFLEEVDYALLADMLDVVANDIILEAKIHPQRLSQIRVVYHDPHSKRGEGDSIVSKIGAWEFIIGDLIGEIIGGGPEDEGALAVRYTETTIPTVYIYFSSEIMAHATIAPWGQTATVKLRK